jgi:hypothetical protein
LPDAQPYVLDCHLIRRFFEQLTVVFLDNLRHSRLNQTLHSRRRAQAPAAIPCAGTILHESAGLAADHFAICRFFCDSRFVHTVIF